MANCIDKHPGQSGLGCFHQASFNLLLESMPSNQVPIITALYQIVVALSLALGALVGSVIVAQWGFVAVMIASAGVRWLAIGLFTRMVLT